MAVNKDFWKDRPVLVTGHTGFKGSWLSVWLHALGADVSGYALDPPTRPSLYADARVNEFMTHDIRADIRDRDKLDAAFHEIRPDVVIHLAAQSLVSEGYRDPIGTYETNVTGTANVLMSAFACPTVKSIISVTSDKCYENREWVHPYRETDRLGGKDPYSSSKGCAEILTASLCASMARTARVASVRAGNVIGGGDWAQERLIPDCVRAFSQGQPVQLRHPDAVRPWQLVLEPLAGYLMLAERLAAPDGAGFEGGWNFGPMPGGEMTVLQVARLIAATWGNGATVEVNREAGQFREANLLRLDSTKARVQLGWHPRLDGQQGLEWTADWYAAWSAGLDLRHKTVSQVEAYAGLAE